MGVQRDVGGTGACRAQWAIQAGGTSGIARSDGTSRLCEFPGTSEYSPLILLDPAQCAACWNPYRNSIKVNRNLNSRLRYGKLA